MAFVACTVFLLSPVCTALSLLFALHYGFYATARHSGVAATALNSQQPDLASCFKDTTVVIAVHIKMARRLTPREHDAVMARFFRGVPNKVIADDFAVTDRTIRRLRARFERTGTTRTMRRRRVGRPRLMRQYMVDAVCALLLENPCMEREEIALHIEENFGQEVSVSLVTRELRAAGWSWKKTRRVARQRISILQNFYLWRMLVENEYESYHLVFVDESGCNKLAAQRDRGWAPVGQAPVHVDEFNRDKKIQILPAYAQDGILHAKMYRGSTDSVVFEEFIQELLPLLGKFPAPKSVLVIDNASFHHSRRIRRMCEAVGVRILFLPPYSPDFNPIEEYFAELKRFIKKHWHREKDHSQPFHTFLRWCVYQVGERRESAEGHFRHSGITIKYPNMGIREHQRHSEGS